MVHARNMLQLRLREPATPAHVERAGRLFADALNALGVSDVGITLVVENDRLRGTLRTRGATGVEGVQSIIDLVRSPVGALSSPAQPGHVALAAVLAKYAREEHRAKPELWRPGRGGELLCSMDETFANVMEALAKAPPVGTQRVRGTTYVHTKILRVGRIDERQQPRVRIYLDGRPNEVPLAEGLATGPFFDAAKREQVVRVQLRVDWLHVMGARAVIRNPLIVGIEHAKGTASGSRIIELATSQHLVTADELPALLLAIDRSDEGDA